MQQHGTARHAMACIQGQPTPLHWRLCNRVQCACPWRACQKRRPVDRVTIASMMRAVARSCKAAVEKAGWRSQSSRSATKESVCGPAAGTCGTQIPLQMHIAVQHVICTQRGGSDSPASTDGGGGGGSTTSSSGGSSSSGSRSACLGEQRGGRQEQENSVERVCQGRPQHTGRR